MTLLEYKSMSLPYELKAQFPENNNKSCRKKVVGTICCVYDDGSIVCYDTINAYPDEFKLILHPLSDLTKEIEHKGEKFVPIDRIKESQYHLFLRDDITNPLEGLQFSEFRKLIEWHFDLAGLIEKGEAIDVNTLKVNPYK